jgi:hypothetical protein
MENAKLKELMLQALEHERGGMKIYETAIRCARNEELKEEWQKYLEETELHVQLLQDACLQLHVDPEEQTPVRKIVRDMGLGFVCAMEAALAAGDRGAAEIVAAECVTLAELKCHSNWEIIGEAARKLGGADGKALRDAHAEAIEQESEHYFHSKGWMRELTMASLGMKAVLPPPEERKEVKTAIGAARAEQERTKMR